MKEKPKDSTMTGMYKRSKCNHLSVIAQFKYFCHGDWATNIQYLLLKSTDFASLSKECFLWIEKKNSNWKKFLLQTSLPKFLYL